MSLLLTGAELERRRTVVAGPLAPLADSLEAELDRLLPSARDVFVPPEKAKLTRRGGRCERDGVLLEFDPLQPRSHRCPHCGAVFDDESHYRWWIMGYQLWLAERAVHSAVMWALRGHVSCRERGEQILSRLAERYPEYPNVDNVLGPTRVFFSTYLEAIWLLQICVAADLLDASGQGQSLVDRVKDSVIEPSARLIALYREGASNRQVWNSAALAAAGLLLGRDGQVDEALFGDGGLLPHLEHGLQDDGTWYEGENYHLFAHRGLWYLMALARRAGAGVPPPLVQRFERGFASPFLTALPDFTLPSRKDSPYRVSLRQWRTAESCELGLARHEDDPELIAALGELYRGDVPAGDAARWRSTAEAERNVPGVRLTRAELGWKSLLFATADLPLLGGFAPRSALLEGQGFAVLRRTAGRVYVALDYGRSGGGHGHPDRLNLWFVDGDRRVLEDPGTGSYVDRTLHWYRSTLAHNAPLVDGGSQRCVDGELLAWDERERTGWVDARATIAPGVIVRRSVVVTDDYLVDRLDWTALREVILDLPVHVEGKIEGLEGWRPDVLRGGVGLEDGYAFVTDAERAEGQGTVHLSAGPVDGWFLSGTPHQWWRGRAPGPPASEPRRFLLMRSSGSSGTLLGVWCWTGAVAGVARSHGSLTVRLHAGARHVHARAGDEWQVERTTGREHTTERLSGLRPRAVPRLSIPARSEPSNPAPFSIPVIVRAPQPGELTNWPSDLSRRSPLRFRLGHDHYRRSELSWAEAGSPEALVTFGATDRAVFVEVSVRKPDPMFTPARDENPLDNEHPDINSDGLQVYTLGQGAAGQWQPHAWIVVPDANGGLRITVRDGADDDIARGWWRPTSRGYQVLLALSRPGIGAGGGTPIGLDVIVNEISAGRERRRGQLVLSGARDEWVYLRGDRHDPRRYLRFGIADG